MAQFTIRECLHGYTNDALGAMCEHWEIAANTKSGRIRAIEGVLQDPKSLESALAELDGPALRLAHLIAHHGNVEVSDILSVPGLIGRQRPEATLHKLTQTGIALSCPQERAGAFSFAQVSKRYQPGEAGPILFVPDHIREKLPPNVPIGIAIPATDGPEQPPAGGPDAGTAIFLETLRIVEAVAPRVTSTGEIHKSDETRAQELCREAGISDDAMLIALTMARQRGCVEERDGRLKTTAEADRWAERSSPVRARELFEGYLHAQDLPDLRLFFPDIVPALEKHMPPRSLRRTYHRTLVARVLAEQPAGAWHAVDAFIETLRVLDRNVLFLEERWRAIESNARDFTPAWQERAWQAHERRLFTWMIGTLFADLGLVELADEGSLFRITPVGRYVLGNGPAPEDDRDGCKDALAVQPDFEIIAFMDRCPANLRRKLDTFCERKRGGPVSTYLLTQESMYRGVRTGVSAGDFLRLIEGCASRAIPSNVRQQFLTWERKLETVAIHAHCQVVECRSAADAAALAKSHPGARVIGDRFVLVDGDVPETGARIDYGNGPRRSCLEPAPGLALRVPWEKCDLFARRIFESIAEVSTDSGGDLVLKLSRAKRKRDEWVPVLDELEAYSGDRLPARYRIALRAWSGDVEPARARSAPIVRFGDADACQAVLEIPELAAELEGRLGDYAVVVKQGRLAALKKKLKEYGIPVASGGTIVDGAPEDAPARTPEPARDRREEPAPEKTEKAEKGGPTNGHNNGEETIKLPSYSPRIIREIIEDAIVRRKPILIEYEPTYGDRPSVRRVNPVALDLAGAAPSLSGYCHTHGGPRAFKLNRINGIRVLEDESF